MRLSKFDLYMANEYHIAQIGKVVDAKEFDKGTAFSIVSKLGKDGKEFTTRGIFLPVADGTVKDGQRISVILNKGEKTPAEDKDGNPIKSKTTGKQIMNQTYWIQSLTTDANDEDATFDL